MHPLTFTPNSSSHAAPSWSSGNVGEGKRAVEHARVADEDVQPAKGVDGSGDRPFVVVQSDDVTADRDHRRAEVRRELVGPGGDPIHDADARAFLDEARHDRLSDARAPARHERDLSIEPAHARVLLASVPRLCASSGRHHSGHGSSRR
jgi:hypothetical protein